jgi:hypothetical protein
LPLTIVIGTGRCGSTMLSRMLQMHPEVLSLSEFWNGFRAAEEGGTPAHDLTGEEFWDVFRGAEGGAPAHDLTGEEFWQRITKPNLDNDGLDLAGLYPASSGRFDPAIGVPSIYRILEPLTGDLDGLYDRLSLRVPAWPQQPMAEHCRALFADLAIMLGRTAIVERSGASVILMRVLRLQFPEARFVFLHRDGPDSAMSMSRFPVFRLGVMRAVADAVCCPSPTAPLSREMLPPEIRAASPEDFKGLIAPPFDRERLMAYPLPLSIFGGVWSAMTRTGTSEIREVPRDRWTTMRYERLIKDTRAELSRLADFIGVPADRQWLDRASDFVDSERPGRAAVRLHPSALAELRAACAAGTRAFNLLESECMASAGSPS